MAEQVIPEESEQDAELRHGVARAIWEDEVLRINLPTLQIRAQDGSVVLQGYAVSQLHRERTERVVRGVRSVQSVENQLVTDDDLRRIVAQGLGRDPRTRGYQFRVDSFRGIVHLFGNVDSPAARLAAEEIATEVPHVRGVVSRLSTSHPQTLPVL
jgi:osmotically-inducible protein OsmY